MERHSKIKELEEIIEEIPMNIMQLKVQLANHDLRGASSLEAYFTRENEHFEHDILLLTKRHLEL